MDPEGGGGVRTPPPLENHKAIGYFSNIGPDLLEKHKAIKPAFDAVSSSAHQRNANGVSLVGR